MASHSNISRLFAEAHKLAEQLRQSEKLSRLSISKDDQIAEREGYFDDRVAERDSDAIDALKESLLDPVIDPFYRLKRLTSPAGIMQSLMKAADPSRSQKMAALMEGTELDKLSLADYPVGQTLVHRMLASLNYGLVGDFLDDTQKDRQAWRYGLVTQALMHSTLQGIQDYADRTWGVSGPRHVLPDPAGPLIHQDQGAAYAHVLRMATSSLDIGMFQFEHSALLAESALAAQRVAGNVRVSLSAPYTITQPNALAMAALRHWLHGVAQPERFMLRFDPRARDDRQEELVGVRGEDAIPAIAHYKFIGANLRDQNERLRAFMVGSANVTLGALGPFERDGIYQGGLGGNIEVSYLATHDLLVRPLKGDTAGRMDLATFRAMTDAAAEAADFIHGSGPDKTWGNAYFMTGDVAFQQMNKLLEDATKKLGKPAPKSSRLFMTIDVLSQGSSWQSLRQNMLAYAQAGGEVLLLMEGLDQANWAGHFQEDKLKASGHNLARIREILGLHHQRIHLADNFGRRVHGKSFFLDDPNSGLKTAYIGSANITERALNPNLPQDRRNIDLMFRVTSEQDKRIGDSFENLINSYGVALNVLPATVDNAHLRDWVDIWSTPLRARNPFRQENDDLLQSWQRHLKDNHNTLTQISDKTGYSRIMSLSSRVGRTDVDTFSVEIFDEGGHLYLPAYQKEITQVLGFQKRPGINLYESYQKIDPTHSLASAVYLTDQFIKNQVIGTQIRDQARKLLARSQSGPVSEADVDHMVEMLVKQSATKYQIQARARAFFRTLIGSFEGNVLGERAYQGKLHQHLAYEFDSQNPLNLLANPAEMGFSEQNFTGDFQGWLFQKPSDHWLERKQVDPITGLAEVEIGKFYTADSFRSLPIASMDDREEHLTLFIPLSKMFQLPQRIGNLFGLSDWNMGQRVAFNSLSDRPTQPGVIAPERYRYVPTEMPLAPFQPQSAFDEHGRLLEAEARRSMNFNAVVRFGPSLMNDVADVNAGAFKNPLVRQQDISISLSDADNVLKTLQQLKADGTILTDKEIVVGQGRAQGQWGPRLIEHAITNPAHQFGQFGGGAQIAEISYRPDPITHGKLDITLRLNVFTPMMTGMRNVAGAKFVARVVQEEGFAQALAQSNLRRQHDILGKYYGIQGAGDVTAILNPSQIKTGDIILQTGAHLLRQGNFQTFLNEFSQVGLDLNKAIAAIQRRLDPKELHQFGLSDTVAGEMQRMLAAPDAADRIRNLFGYVDQSLQAQPLEKRVLNAGLLTDQTAASLAYFMGEQFFFQSALQDILRGHTSLDDFNAPMASESFARLEGARKRLLTMTERLGEKDPAVQKSLQDLRSELESVLDVGYFMPVVVAGAIASNTSALSKRPESKLLTYMNTYESSRSLQVLKSQLGDRQKAVLHAMGMMFTGFGEVGGREQGVSRMGDLSAAMVAAFAEPGIISQGDVLVPLPELVRQLHNVEKSLGVSLAEGRFDDADRVMGKALEVLTQNTPEAFRAMYAEAGKHKTRMVDSKGRPVFVDEFLTTLERANVGAQTLLLPMVTSTPRYDGQTRLQLTDIVRLPMLDPQMMRALTTGAKDSSQMLIAGYQKILRLMAYEMSTLKQLATAGGEGVLLADQSRVLNVLKIAEEAQKIAEGMERINWSELLREGVGGITRGKGTVATVITHETIPTGMAVVGRLPFDEQLNAMRQAATTQARQLAQAEGVDDRGALNVRSRQLLLQNLGLDGGAYAQLKAYAQNLRDNDNRLVKALNDSALGRAPGSAQQIAHDVMSPINRQRVPSAATSGNKLHLIASRRIQLGEHDSILDAYQSYDDKIDALERRQAQLLSKKPHHNQVKAAHAQLNLIRKDLAKARRDQRYLEPFLDLENKAFAVIDQALATYERLPVKIQFQGKDSAGKVRAIDFDVTHLAELRRERARAQITELLKKGTTLGGVEKFVEKLAVNLALQDPSKMVGFGGRVAGPPGSEGAFFLSVSADEFTALHKRYGLHGLLPDLLANQGSIALSVTAQGMALGDFDGDMDALMFASRKLELRSELRYWQNQRQQILQDPNRRHELKHATQRWNSLRQELTYVNQRLSEDLSGLSYVKSVMRYTGRRDLVDIFREDPTRGLDLAQRELEQTRGLAGNLDQFLDSYLSKFHEKGGGKLLGEQADQTWMQIHEEALEHAFGKQHAKLSEAVTLPTHLTQERMRFLNRYIGFAASNVIGHTFNTSYALMTHLNVETGIFPKDGRQTAAKLSGYLKAFNQMARDAIKPKGSELTFLNQLMEQNASPEKAAAANVLGAKSIAYLKAILQGSPVVKDLAGEQLDVHDKLLHNDNPSRIMDGVNLFQGHPDLYKRAVLTMAQEMTQFHVDTILNPGNLLEQIVSHDVPFDVLQQVAGEAGINISSYDQLKEDATLRNRVLDYFQSDGSKDPIRVGVDFARNRSVIEGAPSQGLQRLVETLFDKHRVELSLLFSSPEKRQEYEKYLEDNRKALDRIKAGDQQINLPDFQFDLGVFTDLAVQNTAMTTYLDEMAARAADATSTYQTDTSLATKVKALMYLGGRHNQLQHPDQALAIMTDIVTSTQDTGKSLEQMDKQELSDFERRVNQLDLANGMLGTTLRYFHETSFRSGLSLDQQQHVRSLLADDFVNASQGNLGMMMNALGIDENNPLLQARVEEMVQQGMSRSDAEAKMKSYFARRADIQDNMAEIIGLTTKTRQVSPNLPYNAMFDFMNQSMERFASLDTPEGRTSFSIGTGAVSGIIGAAVSQKALEAQGLAGYQLPDTVNAMTQAFLMGGGMNSLSAFAATVPKGSHEGMMMVGSMLLGGTFGGILGEAIGASRIPRNWSGPLRTAAGILGSAVAGALGAEVAGLAARLINREPLSSIGLSEAASGLMEQLGETVAAYAEDPTQTAELDWLDRYEDDGSGDWNTAEWLDEDGLPLDAAA